MHYSVGRAVLKFILDEKSEAIEELRKMVTSCEQKIADLAELVRTLYGQLSRLQDSECQ